MKFKIPRGATLGFSELYARKFENLMPILLDDTNLDRMFTQFFELLIKGGSMSLANYKRDFAPGGAYSLEGPLVPALATNPKLHGFSEGEGLEILKQWLEISVLVFKSQGRLRQGRQIDHLKNLTAATFRSGLPTSESRSSHRNVNTTVYRALVAYLQEELKVDKPSEQLRVDFMKTSLTRGINLGMGSVNDLNNPKFDEKTELDINSVLTFRFLELFEGKKVEKRQLSPWSSPIAKPLSNLAKDFFNITTQFGNRSSVELLQMYKSIFSLRLYQLPLYMTQGLKMLQENLTLPELSEVGIFVDFSSGGDGKSANLAKESCCSDLGRTTQLIRSMIYFREAYRFSDRASNEQLREDDKNGLTMDVLLHLVKVAQSATSRDRASGIITSIKNHFSNSEDSQELISLIDDAEQRCGGDPFLTLVSLILEDIEDMSVSGLRKWFLSVGGLKETRDVQNVWILAGSQSHTETWRYSLSDSVLVTLLNLSFLNEKGILQKRRHLELSEVIQRFESRFGILISKTPKGFDSLENREAARENLYHFKTRLRQLGWFENLSDDFEAQLVSRPDKEKIHE